MKQKRDKELGYPMWVFGPGFMMIRLFLPDVRPDSADGAAEASKATRENRNNARELFEGGADEIG